MIKVGEKNSHCSGYDSHTGKCHNRTIRMVFRFLKISLVFSPLLMIRRVMLQSEIVSCVATSVIIWQV